MKNVIAYIHTHWDREWYREFQEFRLRLIEVFDEVLDELAKGNLPCFYFDGQTSAIMDYLEIRPEKTSLVKYFIKEKKLRIGPFFCSSDSFLVCSESLYRNLKFGIKTAKELGEDDFIAYIADSFGHSKDMSEILKNLKITKACLWRGLPSFNADFNWNGIRVTNLIQGYFQDFLHSDLSIEKKAQNLKNYLDKISENSDKTLLLPIGADHLGIVKNISAIIKEINKHLDDYNIILSSPFEYFNSTYAQKIVKGEFLDNSKTFLLKGVYSARPYIKRENANIQWILTRIAEPLNVLCSEFWNAKNKQSEINYAYKELIKNHAHDSIYGCYIDEVDFDVLNRYKTVNTIAKGVIKRTLRDIENDKGKLSVINLSNYKYSGKVIIETEKILPVEFNAVKISTKKSFTDKKLYNINDIPITEDITNIHTYLIDVKDLEPFSLTNITKDNICSEKFIKTDKNSIENKFIKISVKNNQLLITDKITNEEYNNFIEIKDRADIGDSYNFGALKGDSAICAKMKSFKIKEVDNIKAVMQILYEIKIPLTSNNNGRSNRVDKCKTVIDFVLYNQSKMAEIHAEWINKSKNHILSLGFNLKDNITKTISEDLYTTVKREFNPEYDIYKEIPAPKGIELKTNTAPMQRFVNAQNLTVITKGINEYEIDKNTLSITLLRSTGIISNPKNPTRGTPAGPPIETPLLQCLGKNTAKLAFAFNSNEDNMYKLAEEFYNPCVSLFTDKGNKIFFTPKGRVYAVTRENSKIVTRVYDNKLKNVIIKN